VSGAADDRAVSGAKGAGAVRGAAQDGAAQDGAAQDGAAQDGAAQDGAASRAAGNSAASRAADDSAASRAADDNAAGGPADDGPASGATAAGAVTGTARAEVVSGEAADGGTASSTGAGAPLVVRPFRVRVAAWIGAVVLVAVMVVIAALLPTTVNAGVYFRLADQVALVLLGLLFAAGALLLARPRVRADADGVEVRNTGLPRRLAWRDVRRVAFPDGASWARLDLPDDEYLPVLAVQAADGARAVEAITALRALHAAARARDAEG
jgi:hypothetical protein